MKVLYRFFVVLLPFILVGAAFLIFPKFRPDTSELRVLRKTNFLQGISIQNKVSEKEIRGYMVVYSEHGFRVLDIGKLRIAFRDDTINGNEGMGPWTNYSPLSPTAYGSAGSGFNYSEVPISIDPPRGNFATGLTKISRHAVPTTVTELPGGTRIDLFGTRFDFENGEVVIDGQTFSTIEKPMLIVLREDHTIELAEALKPAVMPGDTTVPFIYTPPAKK